DGGVEVAIGLVERLLAVHHAGAGELPELLDVGGGEASHVCLSSNFLEVFWSVGGSGLRLVGGGLVGRGSLLDGSLLGRGGRLLGGLGGHGGLLGGGLGGHGGLL